MLGFKIKKIILLTSVIATFFVLLSSEAKAWDIFEYRTWKRAVSGAQDYPSGVFAQRKHQEFTSYDSNWDIQGEFPEAWKNEEWDTKDWPKDWREDISMIKLFRGGIFRKHYIKDKKMPVLVVGPTFYKLSDLDRNRVLKFFTDESGVLKGNYDILELVDWGDNKIIGSYTKDGMFLY